jgi:hypothetical protein
MPFKLPPLWYTPWLPVLFFVSAVALGMMMVSAESLISHWLYRKQPERPLVAGLAKAVVWVLGIYLVVRIGEIIAAGEFGLIFNGTWESGLFIAEMLIAVIIPLVLFSIPSLRARPAVQWTGSLMVVFGMVFNRLNVGGVTMLRATGDAYVPSWMEIAVSLGVVSTAALVFLFAVEKFHIWEAPPKNPEADPYARPQFDHASEVWLGSPFVAARAKYSLAFVLAFAIGFAVMPGSRIESRGIVDAPVHKARGGDVLFIDGNHDQYGVSFNHARHVDSLGGTQSCDECHHMNKPMDQQTGCWECHRQMYRATDAFNHDWHASPEGANLSCQECHEDVKRAETAKKCDACHLDLVPARAKFKYEERWAPPYVDAMHISCLGCHQQEAADDPERENLTMCASCHQSAPPEYLRPEIMRDWQRPYFNKVVLPVAPPPVEDDAS